MRKAYPKAACHGLPLLADCCLLLDAIYGKDAIRTRSRPLPTAAFVGATFDPLSGSCCSKAIAYGGAGMLSNTFAVVIRDVSVA